MLIGSAACSSSTRAQPVPRGSTTDSWTTYHYTQSREGYDAHIPKASGRLSRAWTTTLDGAVYGEPLVINATVVVVTENDTAYGLSLAGAVRWKQHVGTPVPLSELPCGNIDPLGITGTPSYDAVRDEVYFTAEIDNPVRHILVALDPSTGHVSWSHSTDPPGMVVRATQQRGALAIAQGRVWVPFGGLDGDCGPYHGWVVGSLLSGGGRLSVYRQPSAREAGIWAPSGPAVDRHGHVYVAVGNGASLAPPYDDSDSVLELDGARVVSLFAPASWAQENASDQDLGSTGPVLFTALGEDWVFAAGKAGDGYLLHQGDLGGIGGQVATVGDCQSFGGFAFHAGVILAPCKTGMTAYRIDAGPALTPLWHNPDALFGAAPVIGGGAVWAVYGGELLQIDPATGDTVTRITVGDTPHFATPTLNGALVLVGTMTGVAAVGTA